MKKFLFIISVALLALTACSNSKVDTAKLQSVFQSASEDTKKQLNESIAAIDATNYAAALPFLRTVAYGTKLTKEQRDAVVDALNKVQAQIKKSGK